MDTIKQVVQSHDLIRLQVESQLARNKIHAEIAVQLRRVADGIWKFIGSTSDVKDTRKAPAQEERRPTSREIFQSIRMPVDDRRHTTTVPAPTPAPSPVEAEGGFLIVAAPPVVKAPRVVAAAKIKKTVPTKTKVTGKLKGLHGAAKKIAKKPAVKKTAKKVAKKKARK